MRRRLRLTRRDPGDDQDAILGLAQLMESDSPPPTPSQKESIAQILQAGFFRYITKPIKVSEFIEAVDLALELAGNRFETGK